MAQLLPFEGALKNLRQEIPPHRRREYLTREQAYELLKKWTGEDFGYDVAKWEEWVLKNENRIYRRLSGQPRQATPRKSATG